MVSGPKGFLWYVGRTPGYSQLIRGTGKVLVLRRRKVRRQGADYVVGAE